MRCPKCGAFLDEGRTKCFMCGAEIGINENGVPVVNDAPLGNNPSDSSIPGLGAANRDPHFYRGVTTAPIKANDRDVIDFIQEHKTIIRIILILIGIAILSFVIYKVVVWKKSAKIPDPVFSNLYYEIDSSFVPLAASTSSITYSKNGSTGTECAISINITSGTDTDHISTFFDGVYAGLTPAVSAGSPVDFSAQISRSDTSFQRRDATWYLMNVFYRNDTDFEFTILKYQYLTSVYNGYYYDIQLANYANTEACSLALDKFTKTLQFTN